MKRFYRIYTFYLSEEEKANLEFFIWSLGGKYYYLNPNHPKHPCDWMIVKMEEVFSNFPISPDYYQIISDSSFLKDCVTDSIRRVN